MAEGTIGLLRALDSYDPTKARFSTYAVLWITNFCRRYLTKDHLIYVPQNVRAAGWTRSKERGSAAGALGRAATDDEIGELMGMTPGLRRRLEDAENVTGVASLDAPLGEEGEDGLTLGSVLAETLAENPEQAADAEDAKDQIAKMITALPDRPRRILEMRFGLAGRGHAMTLDEVGRTVGLSKERVRQIEQKAIKCLGTRRSFYANQGSWLHRGGPLMKFDDAKKTEFVASIADGRAKTIGTACGLVGISYATYANHRKSDPVFRERVERVFRGLTPPAAPPAAAAQETRRVQASAVSETLAAEIDALVASLEAKRDAITKAIEALRTVRAFRV